VKLSDKTIEQVKENRALIESRDWLKIWKTLKNPELNAAFVELGYNPLSGLKEIPRGYFYGCTPLTSIEIPNSIISIGSSAFFRCSSLANAVIGDSVTSIGNSAFAFCTSLTSIEIPNTVTSMGDFAFSHCTSLTIIEYGGTKEQWNNISKGYRWVDEVPATKVICNDGEVGLI
jgi:hypothetical protein